MKMNSTEWWQILLGCLASIAAGAGMPIFAILFGEILGVSSATTTEMCIVILFAVLDIGRPR